MGVLDKILRAGEGRKLRALSSLAPDITAYEPEMQKLTDEQLQHKTVEFREQLDHGAELDDLLIEAFAVVREAASRSLGQRHYDVQMMGGAALHFGWVAEMKTGEGKTLVSTLPLYLNALAGNGVHLITVNDYLASFHAEWMGRLHRFMGLSVGLILPGRVDSAHKRAQYACDITYGTNNEFGFDYLRDNMAMSSAAKTQRGHAFAVVDEVDSILIDEARTPLIISGRLADAAQLYHRFASIVRGLQREEDYEVDEEKRIVAPTESGVEKVEAALGVENLYDAVSQNLVHQFQAALKAKELYKRDKDYVIQSGEVKIVDEFTGRILDGRRWSEGLHQAVEAKEGVRIKEENQTLATITLQNYFRLYDKLAGMTGTALTEAAELGSTYDLQVVPIPTNKDVRRRDEPDLIYKTEDGKFDAVVEDLVERYETGQPVLVGTISVEKSEKLSRLLDKRGIPTRCSTPSSTSARPTSSRRPAGSTRSRWPRTWPAVASTSSSAATPRAWPSRTSRARASTTRTTPRARPATRSSSSGTRSSARPRARRSASWAASTCWAPSATTPAASTTSSGAAPAARATPARAGSSCRSRTTSCGCSPPAP
jgi:preprotein translocase subunit SecA